jgi:D-alanyl-D-alanine carboxypeptidase/D-alanyl-D-alanine-endopeptidase (penicillin-binding protein 4)
MYLSPRSAEWKSLLPVGAFDGTLERRFAKNVAAKSIQAKTGSLSHVNALSGYAESATYGELSFSIIVNHTSAPASEVRSAIDRIGLALLD